MTVAVDQLNRPFRNLSISLTDRYNFRCVYYMPKEMFGRLLVVGLFERL